MSCNCEKKGCDSSGCDTGSGTILFDGLPFICENESGETLFEIEGGENLNNIFALIFQQVCNVVGIKTINGSVWYSDTGVPNSNLGNVNDFYLDSSNGDIYNKLTIGNWGSVILNISGVVGSNGIDGLSFRHGTGVPIPALGSDGDTYVDLGSTDFRLYIKSFGNWIDTGLDIRGPAGVNGTNGTNGTNGLDGFNFIQGIGVPNIALGNDNDSYIDSDTGDLYHKLVGAWVLTGNIFGGGLSSLYGFRGIKTIDQILQVLSAVGSFSVDAVFYEDDTTLPTYFDNGNDMFVNQYIVPTGGITQKFCTENINWISSSHTAGGNIVLELAIYVNGVIITGVGNTSVITAIGAGTSGFIPSIITDYVTLNSGDIVNVLLKKTGGPIGGTQPTITIQLGAIFSNSF